MAKNQAAKKPARTTRSIRQTAQHADGPLYLVLADSYIDQSLRKAGATVVYFGLPGRALRPLNGEAKKRKQEVMDINKKFRSEPDKRQEALRELSDEWNGVERSDEDFDDIDPEFDEKALEEAAKAQREADQAEADERAKLTASGEANKGADGGKGAADMAAAAKFS